MLDIISHLPSLPSPSNSKYIEKGYQSDYIIIRAVTYSNMRQKLFCTCIHSLLSLMLCTVLTFSLLLYLISVNMVCHYQHYFDFHKGKVKFVPDKPFSFSLSIKWIVVIYNPGRKFECVISLFHIPIIFPSMSSSTSPTQFIRFSQGSANQCGVHTLKSCGVIFDPNKKVSLRHWHW